MDIKPEGVGQFHAVDAVQFADNVSNCLPYLSLRDTLLCQLVVTVHLHSTMNVDLDAQHTVLVLLRSGHCLCVAICLSQLLQDNARVQSSACYKRMYAYLVKPSATFNADLSIIEKGCQASSTGEVKSGEGHVPLQQQEFFPLTLCHGCATVSCLDMCEVMACRIIILLTFFDSSTHCRRMQEVASIQSGTQRTLTPYPCTLIIC